MAYLNDSSVNEFYDNLTLGLIKLLETTPGVQDVELDKKLPCDRMVISSWEQRHSCLLPDDMRQFYAATDGFKLIWNYEYAGEILPIGNLKINSLNELKRIAGIKPNNDPETPSLLDVELSNKDGTPSFGVKCKIFEIDPCQNIGKICLVYAEHNADEAKPEPKIWLLDRGYEWHFLADSFSQYFRMMLVHLGLPQWQFNFTSIGLTPWAEQMMVMVAPYLLAPDSCWLNQTVKQMPPNTIDPAVFKSAKSTKTSKHKTEK